MNKSQDHTTIRKHLNIAISSISYDQDVVYLPYIYGLLRSHASNNNELSGNLTWLPPLYRAQQINQFLESSPPPDVLGLSCYVWNTNMQHYLAQLIKQRWPECLIVAGGPNIPDKGHHQFFDKYPHFDILVHGEGEETFSEILLSTLHPELNELTSINGISYRKGNTPQSTSPRQSLSLETNDQNPYRFPEFKEAILQLNREGVRVAAALETNRGCPYQCSFCDWGSATKSKIRAFSDDIIESQIRWFSENKIFHTFICDSNFGILKRDKDIANLFVKNKSQTGYPKDLIATFAKNSNSRILEISQDLAKANLSLIGATISVQSMDETVLSTNGRKNIGKKKYQELISRYREVEIPFYTEVMVGLPKETKDTFVSGICELLNMGVHDIIRIYPLILLPNSPMNSPQFLEQHAIKTVSSQHWGVADNEEVKLVVGTDTMTTNDWVWMMVFATLIQAFHCGGRTQFISRYLKRSESLDYKSFYLALMKLAQKKPDSLINKLINDIEGIFLRMINCSSNNYSGWEKYQIQWGQQPSTLGSLPHIRLWMKAASDEDQFCKEIIELIKDLNIHITDEILAVLDFQKNIILNKQYDPILGKELKLNYDFANYFKNDIDDLKRMQNTILIQDTHFGSSERFSLMKNMSAEQFMLAATGGTALRANHFVHSIKKTQSNADKPSLLL